MTNIASALKSEIARVARKELKDELQKLKKATAQYRSEIAALKRRTASLEQLVKRLGRPGGKAAAAPAAGQDEEADGGRLRFSATRFAAQRTKLGVSANDMGTLLGVSGQSVYKWEKGLARPRRSQLEAIAALRKIGKREAAQRLAPAAQ